MKRIKKIKLPRKYGYLISAVLMPLSVSLGGTFLHTTISAGFSLTAGFWGTWLASWVNAYSIALPISLASAPFVRKIVERVTH